MRWMSLQGNSDIEDSTREAMPEGGGGINEVLQRLEVKEFTNDQIHEIQEGIEEGLDLTVYAKKEFLAIQMQEIRKGLEAGLDIATYASYDIPYDKMRQIRKGLIEGIELHPYKRLDAGVLREMRYARKQHVNIIPFIAEGYDAEHYSITISEDEMEAYLEVHGASEEFNKIDLNYSRISI